MITFFAIIAVIGLIGWIVSSICLITDQDPFGLWATLCIVCPLMFVIGSGCALASIEIEKPEEQIVEERHDDVGNQYSYCPYCGEELK